MSEQPVPEGVDPNRMSVARVYDALLGGTHNFEVDRLAVEQMKALFPDIVQWAWGNRGFHQRAARWLAEKAGIRQFIDIGSGLPTQNNTHEVVHSVAPGSHVVYVDIDPMVAAYANSLLAGAENTVFIQGDLRDPQPILNNEQVRAVIDFDQPVALMLTAILHFVQDDAQPERIVAEYMAALPSGSYLALSHSTTDGWGQKATSGIEDLYKNANEQPRNRTKAEVSRFFEGLEIVPPYAGAPPELTFGGLWGADDPEEADDDASHALYCAVARKP